MIDHDFKIVQHYKIGPVRNKWGYVISIAEVDSIWVMQWESPYNGKHWQYYADHDAVIHHIELLNADRRY